MKTISRQATNKLLEMIEEGLLDKDNVIMACVKYMSEDDVADMCHANEFFAEEEEFPIEDEDEVRAAFWEAHPQYTEVDGQTQNDYPTDVRVAFCDYVDYLQKDGQISEELAGEVTL